MADMAALTLMTLTSAPMRCWFTNPIIMVIDQKCTRRRMARERRGAGSSLVSMETPYYKQYIKDVL
jgi:hypothetical protein